MQIGSVVGNATATTKHLSLTGSKLLVVQLLSSNGGCDGEPVLAIDQLGAGIGDRVVLTNDGASAREAIQSRASPVRWMVIGVCDR